MDMKLMGFNYNREYQKWLAWKEKEEALLRRLNTPEHKIKELRHYDFDDFKRTRNIVSRHIPTKENFFDYQPFKDHKIISSIDEMLDEIEQEFLYDILLNSDLKTLYLLFLRIEGYSVSEISNILKISRSSIYYRLRKLRKKIKNLPNV